jgi:osmoprotectant transport system ATP-binding protein
MQTPNAPTIRFDRLTLRYGETAVLHDLSLTIAAGELVVLLGPSGSGKTSLLRSVNRMVEPASGRVLIDDADIATRSRVQLRRSIGYVMQASGLFPHVTVQDNIATVPRLLGASRQDARAIAQRTLGRVGLDPALATRYPAQLSGGQQQRVGVARALAADPRILLMDEPFGALDPITRKALQRETLRLHEETGATILFVTHDVDEALAIGDRIIVLDAGGRIAQDATPAEIVAHPADAFVAELLGTTTGDRALHLQQAGETELVVDRTGRPIGVLER